MDANFVALTRIDPSEGKYGADISDQEYFGFPLEPILSAENNLKNTGNNSVAYFSMEYGLAPSVYNTFSTKNPISNVNVVSDHEVFSNMCQMDYYHNLPVNKILDLPIYSGGLGVLAGDTLKSSADLGISLVGIGILWNKGYFRQKLWFRGGGQFPEELSWDPHSYPGLIPLDIKICIELSGQKLYLKLWKYYVYSYDKKNVIPLLLLDANVDKNPDYLKELTAQLYRSSNGWLKIAQRMILGIGGIRALEALGYSINKYHMNEGHAVFAFVEMAGKVDTEQLKGMFSFTCHTPVEAGHDRFNFQELEAALGTEKTNIVRKFGTDPHSSQTANLTILGLNACNNVNAVSKKHGDVMHIQFPHYKDKITSVTNGIHTFTWLSKEFSFVLKKYKDRIGDFENDPTLLKNIENIKSDPQFRADIWKAHFENKKELTGLLKFWFFKPEVFTIAWARRIAMYKRPTMILHDTNRLLSIARKYGQIQIIIAGKAHPADTYAAKYMDQIMDKISMLSGEQHILRIVFLENYDTYFAKILTGSVDVWLNNPIPPFEASGTSGMKAIVNGVTALSTLDGWVVEAADKNIGKIFGYVPIDGVLGDESNLNLDNDSNALYDSLEQMVSTYYDTVYGNKKIEESAWIDMMINCLIESAYFSTHRMVREYKNNIWHL